MRFAFIMLAGMYAGRRFGWWLSRNVLYADHGASLALLLMLWGIGVAWIVRSAIDAALPGTAMRFVFGYALGAYVAIPNYGLLIESTIPAEDRPRHLPITGVPLITYLTASALLPVRWLPALETVLVVGQWFLFVAVGYWLSLRQRRLWRTLGLLFAVAFVLNAIISLVDLGLIGDALPGGHPSPPGWDPTHAQALGEYAGTSLALIAGWIGGRHHRQARDDLIAAAAQISC